MKLLTYSTVPNCHKQVSLYPWYVLVIDTVKWLWENHWSDILLLACLSLSAHYQLVKLPTADFRVRQKAVTPLTGPHWTNPTHADHSEALELCKVKAKERSRALSLGLGGWRSIHTSLDTRIVSANVNDQVRFTPPSLEQSLSFGVRSYRSLSPAAWDNAPFKVTSPASLVNFSPNTQQVVDSRRPFLTSYEKQNNLTEKCHWSSFLRSRSLSFLFTLGKTTPKRSRQQQVHSKRSCAASSNPNTLRHLHLWCGSKILTSKNKILLKVIKIVVAKYQCAMCSISNNHFGL